MPSRTQLSSGACKGTAANVLLSRSGRQLFLPQVDLCPVIVHTTDMECVPSILKTVSRSLLRGGSCTSPHSIPMILDAEQVPDTMRWL